MAAMDSSVNIDIRVTRRSYWRRFRLSFCEGAGLMGGIVTVLLIAKVLGL